MTIGKTYTAEEVGKLTAGTDTYIRTKNGVVRGLAITQEKNPNAPEILVVGNKPNVIKRAELLRNTRNYVPLFLKRDSNEWEYMGQVRYSSHTFDPEVIERYRGLRLAKDIYGIFFLKMR